MTSGYDDEDFEIIILLFIDIYISDKAVLKKKFCHNFCQFIFTFYIFISVIEKKFRIKHFSIIFKCQEFISKRFDLLPKMNGTSFFFMGCVQKLGPLIIIKIYDTIGLT